MAFSLYCGHAALGRTQHSTVFLGIMNLEKVAVKRARGIEGRRRVALEAEQLQKLEHRNVVKFYKFQNWLNATDLVLELAEGKNLADALGIAEIPTRDWKQSTIHQISDGVAYIHDQGIQHRDLKPRNILFKDTQRARVLIADFGMATSESQAATAGAKVFQRPDKTFTQASDIYCLAQIACCILEDENPRGRKHLRRIRERFLSGISGVLLEFRQSFGVLERALSADSVLRPPASEFRDAFERPAADAMRPDCGIAANLMRLHLSSDY